MKELLQAWINLLDGFITYNGKAVQVFKIDLPEDFIETATVSPHYIWLYGEGGSDDSNKHNLVSDDVVVVNVVTVHENNVNPDVAETIDASIRARLYASPTVHNLIASNGKQFGQTIRETYYYTTEGDVQKQYRKISRYKTRIANA